MPLRIIKRVLLLATVALFAFCVLFVLEFSSPQKISSEKVFFEVEKGKGIDAIAQDLKKKGLIRKKWPFLLGYQLFFYPQTLKAGEYVFSSPLWAKDILDAFVKGKVYFHPVTIPEGLTAKEISELLPSLGFLPEGDIQEAFSETEAISSWDRKAWNLEGYLYPETYHFAKGTSILEIFERMVVQFKAVFHEGWRRRAADLKLTIREVVTLASMIEKETSLSEEKRLVSAVFHNRLKLGMKLDCDPTIIYALKEKGLFEGRLRNKDLKFDSPYNTYLYSGLPPSPICNPGKESLEAALYPVKENYLYFVSKNDGSHHFSSTFSDHQIAVRKYQK